MYPPLPSKEVGVCLRLTDAQCAELKAAVRAHPRIPLMLRATPQLHWDEKMGAWVNEFGCVPTRSEWQSNTWVYQAIGEAQAKRERKAKG